MLDLGLWCTHLTPFISPCSYQRTDQNVAQRPFIRAALGWAQKYGLDVVMDLHGLPNSQNGYDNVSEELTRDDFLKTRR